MNERRPFSPVDLLISLALFLLLTFALGAAGVQSAREVKNRLKCSNNLREIGLALKLYANENRGAFPRTIYDADQAEKPVWGTPYEGSDVTAAPTSARPGADPFAADNQSNAMYRPAANDVTAALYLLMRTQDITSTAFVCPSAGIRPWNFGGGDQTAMNWTNFNGRRGIGSHLSYSYQNAYATRQAAQTFRLTDILSAEFAVAADMNPGTDALLQLKLTSPADQIAKGNSLNHRRDGQNVLYADAHVEFQNTPFCGIRRDNIYTASGRELVSRKGEPAIVASPADGEDSILLPTASDVGFREPPAPADVPLDDPRVFAMLVGRYAPANGRGVLVIEKGKLSLTHGPATLACDYQVIEVDGPSIILRLSGHGIDRPCSMVIEPLRDASGISIDTESPGPAWLGLLAGEWAKEQ